MRVLVDTSVWVDFFNGFASAEAHALERLIHDEVPLATCGVVIAEFFQGIRRKDSLASLRRQFEQLILVCPREPSSYFAAADLFRELRAQGVTIRSTIDCLIAILAEENDLLLLSKDRDLHQILDSGLVQVRSIPV